MGIAWSNANSSLGRRRTGSVKAAKGRSQGRNWPLTWDAEETKSSPLSIYSGLGDLPTRVVLHNRRPAPNRAKIRTVCHAVWAPCRVARLQATLASELTT